jgi:general secretion pathway protein M
VIAILASAKGRRVAALGIAACLAALAYTALVRPVLELHRGYDEPLAALSHRLAQVRRIVADGGGVRKRVDELRHADPARHRYLSESNPVLAAAELQELVKRALVLGSGELISTQVLPAQREGEVTVKVRLRGTVGTLQRTLHALEAGSPMLFVDHLSVDSAAGELVIAFDVTGYRRGRGRAG